MDRFAGSVGVWGESDGDRESATFSYLHDMHINSRGEILLTDCGLVRKISIAHNMVSTVNSEHRVERKTVRSIEPFIIAEGSTGSVVMVERSGGRLYAIEGNKSRLLTLASSVSCVSSMPSGNVVVVRAGNLMRIKGDGTLIKIDARGQMHGSHRIVLSAMYGNFFYECDGVLFITECGDAACFVKGEPIDIKILRDRERESQSPSTRIVSATILGGDFYHTSDRMGRVVVYKNFAPFIEPGGMRRTIPICVASHGDCLYLLYRTHIDRVWFEPRWCPETHHMLNHTSRSAIRLMFMMRLRDERMLQQLPFDILSLIFNMLLW